MIHHRLIRSLARGRLWACGVLGAIPREAHRGEVQREAAALRTSEAECDRLGELLEEQRAQLADKAQVLETYARLRDQAERVEIHRDKLAADLCGAEEARDEAEGERDHALDQARRLEAALEAERLEATALKQQMEDLRSRLRGLSCAENVAVGNVRRALDVVP